jgi:glyceraldehyde-3-phosphate dehydrogenase (NADP+)
MQKKTKSGSDTSVESANWSANDFFPDIEGVPEKFRQKGGVSITETLVNGQLKPSPRLFRL